MVEVSCHASPGATSLTDGLVRPYRLLALAVLHLAVKDVRKPNVFTFDAWRFLRSGWCAHLAEVLSIEHDLARLLGELRAGRRPRG